MSDHEANDPIAVPSDYNPGIVRNTDGSYTRLLHFPCTPPTADDDTSSPVVTKDIPINPNNKTWLRIFFPREALNHSPSTTKLPLIVYYHGGGFVFTSANSSVNHDFCAALAADVMAVVASVEYRVAPEHRLPAAYNDAVEALECIEATKEKWLTHYADFSNCFLMGSSAGANIAYHAGLRVASSDSVLSDPLKIQGLILHQPFFGGSKRTESDVRLANAVILSLKASDFLWDLSLPIGADRDHEFCNPVMDHGLEKLSQVKELGWRVMVMGRFGDHLIDRQMGFVKMLEGMGFRVLTHFGEGYHGVELSEPQKAKELFETLKHFVENKFMSD